MNLKLILVLVSFLYTAQALAVESVYTNVDTGSCITLDSAEFDEEFEIDYYEAVCHGQGPYVIKVSGGDLRYGISLLYRGQELEYFVQTAAFHDLGSDVVEWRYSTTADGERVLKALIFRISAFELDNVSLLHVVKLDQLNSCVVSVLKDEVNDNEKARKIADNIDSYSCM